MSFFKETAIQGIRFGAGTVKIGILAVQGDFEAHAAMLAQLGAETAEVRTPAQLEGCDGLILPGGESTTQLQFLREEGLRARRSCNFCGKRVWRTRLRNSRKRVERSSGRVLGQYYSLRKWRIPGKIH